MNVYQSIIAANYNLNVVQKPATSKAEIPAVAPVRPAQSNSLEQTNVAVVRQGNLDSQSKADAYFQKEQTNHDQPNGRNQRALNQYQSLDIEEKRTEVRTMMGVDTFA